MPELTEEQRSELPKNVITRALGMQDHVTVDLQSDDARIGDTYVLCSDGLSGMLDDGEILVVVGESADISEACRRLVAIANEHGGEDNITAVIVRIEDNGAGRIEMEQPTPAAAPEAPPGPESAAVEQLTDPMPALALELPTSTPAPAPESDTPSAKTDQSADDDEG